MAKSDLTIDVLLTSASTPTLADLSAQDAQVRALLAAAPYQVAGLSGKIITPGGMVKWHVAQTHAQVDTYERTASGMVLVGSTSIFTTKTTAGGLKWVARELTKMEVLK